MSIFRYFSLFLAQMQFGRCVHTAFQTKWIQSFCYLGPKKAFITSCEILYTHKLFEEINKIFFIYCSTKTSFKGFCLLLETANLRSASYWSGPHPSHA